MNGIANMSVPNLNNLRNNHASRRHARAVFKMADSSIGRTSVKFLQRATEKGLQRAGKHKATKDDIFELYQQNFVNQQEATLKLQKEIKNYVACARAMYAAQKSLYETLERIYEPEWVGRDQLGGIKETLDLLWDDYLRKLNDQVASPLVTYQAKFPETKERIKKRSRKLTDYDGARHKLDDIEAAKKKDEGKLRKAQEQHEAAKKVYEEIHNELKDSLPSLYDSRIPFYATTFQLLYTAETTMHDELAKVKAQLTNIMGDLFERASDYDIKKRFFSTSTSSPDVVGNDHRSSSLESGSPKQDLYSVPVPQDARRTPSVGSRASSEAVGQTAESEVRQMEEDDDDDDEDESVEYQIPRSTPVHVGPAPHTTPSQNSAPDRPPKPPPLASPDPDQAANQANGNLPDGVLYRVKATHEYQSRDSDELSFKKGDIIDVVPFEDPEDQDDGWLFGRVSGSRVSGVFPENFTTPI
ncbi:myc box-dependent-interacting protein 1-like isoform X2 [Amphiura filiformis]|uniref:myc box-dependent-interacting protein 1-like isoform X2 n=1 Tax=Amphiura filiformis TaxID=82378 RepID=UPI003B2187C0